MKNGDVQVRDFTLCKDASVFSMQAMLPEDNLEINVMKFTKYARKIIPWTFKTFWSYTQ